MGVRIFLSIYKTIVSKQIIWHFFIFIGIFILTRFIFLDLYEKGKYPYINQLQNAIVQYEAVVISKTLSIVQLSKSVSGTEITFSNNHTLEIFWGCSGLRTLTQVFYIFLILPGPWIKKVWYIPVALFITAITVYIHLLVLSLIIALHPDYFDFAHKYLTKIIVFGAMFLMWVYWEHLIKNKNESAEAK